MKPIKLLLLLLLFSQLTSYSFGQTAQIGLMCVAEGEIPEIFKADLQQSRGQFFDLAQNAWRNWSYSEVQIEELIFIKDGLSFSSSAYLTGFYSERGLWKVHINRTTLELFTMLTHDLDKNGRARTANCSVHTYDEINEIATREYSRLNNRRAF